MALMKMFIAGMLLVLLAASCVALDVYQSPIDCTDGYGHGPDPDTLECKNAIEGMRENRPQYVQVTFFNVLLVGSGYVAAFVAYMALGAFILKRLGIRDD